MFLQVVIVEFLGKNTNAFVSALSQMLGCVKLVLRAKKLIKPFLWTPKWVKQLHVVLQHLIFAPKFSENGVLNPNQMGLIFWRKPSGKQTV